MSAPPQVTIDWQRVTALAESLSRLTPSRMFTAQVAPLPAGVPEEQVLRAVLWAAAICHSTKGRLHGKFEGREVNGWDYLLAIFLAHASSETDVLAPATVSSLSERDLRLLLTQRIANPIVDLNDLDRRAEMLREAADDLLMRYDGSIVRLRTEAQQCVGGAIGAYARLGQLRPFGGDAQHKKSSAFLMTASLGGIWPILDPVNITPMVDYHRMRILLRTGCIEPDSNEAMAALRARLPAEPKLEISLRNAAADVSRRVAELTGHPAFVADVLLWAHARSCCRHNPLCVSGIPERGTFSELTGIEARSPCVFVPWCVGAYSEETRDLWEPMVESELY